MEQALQEIFGERITTDPFECQYYAKDLAYIPPLLVRLLADPMPKAVVQPVSEEEISYVLKWVRQRKIPVTVRGGGSTAYFNSVPIKSGIVIDMNRFQGFSDVEHDPVTDVVTVWVKAGTTWKELDDGLRQKGYAVYSYPSSAPSATIGGWVSMGGMGIGSLPYGPLGEQVQALRGISSNGEIIVLSKPDKDSIVTGDSSIESGIRIDDLMGTEGTRGIITAVKLRIRLLPEQEQHLVAVFPKAEEIEKMMVCLGESQCSCLFNVHFNDPGFIAALQVKGYDKEIPKGHYSLEIDLEGEKGEVRQAVEWMTQKVGEFGGRLLPLEIGQEEWANRFKSLRLKQSMPSLQAAELFLPIRQFAAYIKKLSLISEKAKTPTVSYAHLVSSQTLLVMTLYPSDELNTIQYIADLSFISKIYKLGRSLGGKPYVIGLWNTPYLGQIFSRKERKERRLRKQTLDPDQVLNPGKSYAAPLILHPTIFGLGMISLGLIQPLLRKGGGQG